MFNKIRSLARRIGVKMGIIKELNQITDHQKVYADKEHYDRIELNKSIYGGFVEEWHNVEYVTSGGAKRNRIMLNLGMGKTVAEEMSRLIYNEKCHIDVATKGNQEDPGDPAKEFVHEVLKKNDFNASFERYLEYCYALGGMAIKVYHHKGEIKLSYATADAIYPISETPERIDEMLFIYEDSEDKTYYTLCEWHEWDEDRNYIITNELYESDEPHKLGHRINLAERYPEVEERTIIKGLTRPLFVYFKPNRANNTDLQSALGSSLFDSCHDTLYFLDYLFDYFHHELKLGKRRIAVDYSMLRPYIDHEGNEKFVFDTNETVFYPINSSEEVAIKDLAVELRSDNIIESINAALELLAMQVGFSTGTFTFDGKSTKTAKEIVSENSKTYRTKNSHEVIVDSCLKNLVQSILELASVAGVYKGGTDVDIAINFDDSIAEDKSQNYMYYSTAVRDGLIPKLEAMQRIFKITRDKAKEWMEEILEDQSTYFTEDELDKMGVPSRGTPETPKLGSLKEPELEEIPDIPKGE